MATTSTPELREHDVAIIGGGPAGLAAGIWLARFMHDVIVIDSGDPRNWEAREVHGYLGASRVRPSAFVADIFTKNVNSHREVMDDRPPVRPVDVTALDWAIRIK